MSKPRLETMLTPYGIVRAEVCSDATAERVVQALMREALTVGCSGKEVPVLVFEPGRQPYFSIAEDDAKP